MHAIKKGLINKTLFIKTTTNLQSIKWINSNILLFHYVFNGYCAVFSCHSHSETRAMAQQFIVTVGPVLVKQNQLCERKKN